MLATAELLDCGLTYAAISRRQRRGRLHQLHRGVWAVGHDNPPFEGRLLAAVKACGPGAVLSHRSAAQLWGFLEPEGERLPEVTVAAAGGRAIPGIVTHRTAILRRSDVTRHRKVPITSPPRTLLDLAGVARPRVHAERCEPRRAFGGFRYVNYLR